MLRPIYRYCDRCGIENPGFDEEKLLDDAGKTLEQLKMERCSNGHAAVHSDMANDGGYQRIIEELPFCEYCGQRIL